MKSPCRPIYPYWRRVTLHVRVWIEIIILSSMRRMVSVTLHVRVWIEISSFDNNIRTWSVTLHVRVWIEILVWYCIQP